MNLSSPANLLIAGIYFFVAAVLIFFSLFGVYILIRYGQSRVVAVTASVLYGFIFLSILSGSYETLLAVLQ